MMKKILFNNTFRLLFLLLIISGSGCYYDKKDLLLLPPTCDTTMQATYSSGVKPILSSQCTSCHSGLNPAGYIGLEEFITVKSLAASGLIMHVIKHDPGYLAMPKNGGKLSDCDINKIAKWIAAGEPNN